MENLKKTMSEEIPFLDIKVKPTVDGNVIISIGSESTQLTDGQLNLFMERLNTVKSDAKDFKEVGRKLGVLSNKYNSIGIGIESIIKN